MSYTYDQRTAPKEQRKTEPDRASESAPRLNVMTAGQAAAPPGKGSPDLEAAMEARMRNTFGDLSAVRDYQPPVPTEAPAPAAPCDGPVTHALSHSAPSPSAAGPMQAKREDHGQQHQPAQPTIDAQIPEETSPLATLKHLSPWGETKIDQPLQDYTGPLATLKSLNPSPNIKSPVINNINPSPNIKSPIINNINEGSDRLSIHSSDDFKESGLTVDPKKLAQMEFKQKSFKLEDENHSVRPGFEDYGDFLRDRYSPDAGYGTGYQLNLQRPANPSGKTSTGETDTAVSISGLFPSRAVNSLSSDRGRGFNMSKEDLTEMYDNLMAPHKEGMNDQEKEAANEKFDKGIRQYKQILFDDMLHMEKKYGKLLTQMHPGDLMAQKDFDTWNKEFLLFQQDAGQLMDSGGDKYFDFKNNKDDRKFRDMHKYYTNAHMSLLQYSTMANPKMDTGFSFSQVFDGEGTPANDARELENKINGPQMDDQRYGKYIKEVQKRERTKPDMKGKLFGRYLPGKKKKK